LEHVYPFSRASNGRTIKEKTNEIRNTPPRHPKKSPEKFVEKVSSKFCEGRSAAAVITGNCSHKQHQRCLHPRHIALLQCTKFY